MLITVQCPGCAKQYHLNEDMRGKRIRCINAVCQEIFEVQDGAKAPARAPATPSAAAASPGATNPPAAKQGHISDMIPLVSAETAEAVPPPSPPAAGSPTSSSVGQVVPLVSAEAVSPPAEPPSWQQAPPVRRSTAPAKPAAALPEEKPAWIAAPPPVRRGPASPGPTPPAEKPKPQADSVKPPVTVSPATVAPSAAPPPATSWQAAPPPVRRVAPEPAKPAAPGKETAKLPAEPAKPPPPSSEPAKAQAAPPPAPPAQPVMPQLSLDATNDVAAKAPPGGLPTPAPKEPPAWEAAPPPVRRAAEPTAPPPTDDLPTPAVPDTSETPVVPAPAPARRRFSTYVVLLLLAVCGSLIGWIYWHGLPDPEEVQRQQAEAAFEKAGGGTWKDCAEAADRYKDLLNRFPESERAREYAFYAELSSLLRDVNGAQVNAPQEMDKLRMFLKKWGQDPLIDKNRPKIAEVIRAAIDHLLKPVEEVAKKKPLSGDDLKKIEGTIKTARAWGEEGNPFWIEGALPPSLRDRIEELERIFQQGRERNDFIAMLKKITRPQLVDIEPLNLKARDQGLDKDAEVQELIDRLYKKAVPTVVYVPNPEAAREAVPPTRVDLVVAPRLDTNPTPTKNTGVVFALVRGILYALAENDGHVLWARRVGIDTQHLPIRLPPTETTGYELALVMSSDDNTLTARRVTDGQPEWRHQLGSPALGRPLVVERVIRKDDGEKFLSRRVYVATVDGRVQEIEIAGGQVLGEFRCGLPLLLGGARQPESTLLYFPADREFVFVFDVAQQRTVGVVRTGHRSGSLRGEPILIGAPGKPNDPPAYMVLAQTDGLEAMRLRVFRLPHSWDGQEAKEELPPVAEAGNDKPWWVAGWLWFEPRCDGEKIVLATDAGRLGLFGINQVNNNDSPIFPLLGKKRPTVALGYRDGHFGRSQIIHATEIDFWVLAQGEAQHWRLGFTRRDGQTVGAEWPRALPLGSPLHAGQVNRAGDTLFVVTQALNRPVCRATAIDAETGNIRWQRQLGLVAAHDPVVVNSRVLTLDQSGNLFQFDPALFPPQSEHLPVQEKSLATGAPLATLFSFTSDGSTYLVGSPAANSLLARRYTPGKKPDEATLQEFTFPQALAGTPALSGATLVLPHADGTLRRLPLVKGALADHGLRWRADGADADAPGYVVHLAGHDFLYTDGSQGLFRLSWDPADPVGKKKELKLPPLERIVAAPLVLGGNPLRVCVADASGTITLLRGEFLQKDRSWKLPGKVTAGPLLRGKYVVCVVDGKQVVAIDPEKKDEPAWTFTDADNSPLVGLPQQTGDRLLVAHLNGRLACLDLATGQRGGNGFAIQASAAPAATPVPFGEDRIFVPLTDGSILLLSLDELEGK